MDKPETLRRRMILGVTGIIVWFVVVHFIGEYRDVLQRVLPSWSGWIIQILLMVPFLYFVGLVYDSWLAKKENDRIDGILGKLRRSVYGRKR